MKPSLGLGYAFSNEANVLKSYLPATGTGWTRVETEMGSVAMKPVGANEGTASVRGNRLDIAGIGESVSLSYEVLPGRLKESITLSGPVSAPTFSYALKLEGLTAQKNSDGSVSLLNETGTSVLSLEAPWMQDASGRRSTDIAVTLVSREQGFIYSIAPDREWLESARYPVIIDPTIQATFSGATGTAQSDNPTQWLPATPFVRVGKLDEFDTGKNRAFLGFDVSSLPLDVEIDSARLRFSWSPNVRSGTASEMTIEAREFPYPDMGVADIIWGASLFDDLVIGQDLSGYAVSSRKGFYLWQSFPAYESTGIDVSGIVSSWTDRRFAKNTSGTLRPLKLNIVLSDASENDNNYPYGNLIDIYAQTTGSAGYQPMRLDISYINRGWFMFQGNPRHTGQTQYVINSNPTQRWWAGLPTPNSSFVVGDINPSVVAVPNSSNPTSGLPVVYAAVADYAQTLVYRFEDLGNGRNVSYFTINNFVVTGTPLVIAGVTANDPDKIVVSGRGAGSDLFPRVYCLTAKKNANGADWQILWVRRMETYTAMLNGSPCYSGNTTYKLHRANGTVTTERSLPGGTIIFQVYESDSDAGRSGYLRALSLANGYNVWGHVNEAGELVWYGGSPGGLPA